MSDNTWCIRDGNLCDGSKSSEPVKFNNQFYIEQIKQLEEKILEKDKVIFILICSYLYNVILTISFIYL